MQWSLPHEILTDLGKEFDNELMAELAKLLGVNRLRTSGYRPQTNGAIEVWHRTLNGMLAKVIKDNQRDWPEWVRYVTFCYNATEHSATGFSPFFLNTGRQPVWNVDLLLPMAEQAGVPVTDYAVRVADRIERASELAREHLQQASESASKWYNNKVKPRTFIVGERVRVFYPRRYAGRSPKWQSYFKTEGEIEQVLNDVTYLVRSRSWKQSKVVHVDKLKRVENFTL